MRAGSFDGTACVFARELRASLDTGIALLAAVAAMLVANGMFMNEFFLTARLDMNPLFESLPLLAILFVPAVSMRTWAEERKSRTFEWLTTLPLSATQLVLGKFSANLALAALFIAGTLPVPIMLAFLGEPDLGRIAAGYLGTLLLFAHLLALGSALSALFHDQLAAFVTTALCTFLFVALGDDRVAAVIDGLSPSLQAGTFLRESFSVVPHFQSFLRGAIELGALIYFLGFTTLFLALNAFTVRRYRP